MAYVSVHWNIRNVIIVFCIFLLTFLLVQIIQTLPVALVELPLCLLNRLLVSDPQHTAPCLITAAQASAFLPYSTEGSDNGADHTQNQLNHFGNGVERIKSNGIAKKTKIDHIKGDIKSKKKLERLKGNIDASKEQNDSIKTQYQPSRNKTEKIREVQPKTKIYPQNTMEQLRDKIEQQSGCIEEIMDSLEIHGSSAGRLQDLAPQPGCSISWLIDSLEELRSCDHPKISTAKIRSSPEEVRTAGLLLAVLLQSELLSGCAVELLILLSQLTRHLTISLPSFFLLKPPNCGVHCATAMMESEWPAVAYWANWAQVSGRPLVNQIWLIPRSARLLVWSCSVRS